VFSWAQPIPAYIGLIGCVIIVFVFTSAAWWDTPVDFTIVATVYGAVSSLFSMRLSLNIDIAQPIILFVLWIAFKLYNRRWWVKLDRDFAQLATRLDSLAWTERGEYVLNRE
jgi:hypothetical protein